MPVNFISSITDKGVKFDTESLTVGDAYLLSHKSDNGTVDASLFQDAIETTHTFAVTFKKNKNK